MQPKQKENLTRLFTHSDMLKAFESGMERGCYETMLTYDLLNPDSKKPVAFDKFMDENFKAK